MKTQTQVNPNFTTIKAMNTKELANLYGVTRSILNTWLEPFRNEIGPRLGHYYTVKQMKIILDKLGPYNLIGGILAASVLSAC